MKNRVTLLFIFLLQFSFAQNPDAKRTNHWYFGEHAGIDFSSGTAVADTTGKMDVYAGCSVISDTAGNLLFYMGGEFVWNHLHDTMPNGTGLFGRGTPAQGSVIVPHPGIHNIYYIFHAAGLDAGGDTLEHGFRYSIVDMNSDSGRGDITIKNVLLFRPNTEQVAAIHHANGCDVWVMTHEYHSNNYRAYLVTTAGLDTTPVVTVIGNQIPDSSLNNYFYLAGSELKFTNNGRKMAADMFWDNYVNPSLFDTLELYDFDNATGVLSNRITIADSSCAFYGFSPDCSKLYIGAGTYDAQAYQYDISSNNQSAILSTKTLIYYDSYWNIGDFQETFDKKIICAIGFHDTIPVINYPDSSGIACNFILSGLSLNNRSCNVALPNFIQSYFNDSSPACPTAVNEIDEENDSIRVFPNPFSEYFSIALWCDYLKDAKQINLYNMMGQKVFEKNTVEKVTIVQVPDLPEGIYLLTVNLMKNNQPVIKNYVTKKIIKSNP